jgi:S1-C subfamily serine protease
VLPDDDPDDELSGSGPLLPPEDRLWRHPSELHHAGPDPTGWLVDGPLEPAPRSLWPVAMGSGVVGALVAVAAVALFADGMGTRIVQREVVERVAVTPIDVGIGGPDPSGVVDIAARVSPAIARIEVEGGATGSGSGSGVLFRDDGYLMTNAHVVDGGGDVTVVLTDGEEHGADVVGTDDETDIAVVHIDGHDLPTAVLGTAVGLQVGEAAVAIGSPLGLRGGPSVTAGVVSALGRRIDRPDGRPPLHDMIQTDAPIQPGSSGGALVDASGAVVGITTAIAVSEVGAEGLGFATPIDLARAVAEDIVLTGRAHHVWIGVEGMDLGADEADDRGVDGGVYVERILPDSPAEAAGLAHGDVIVALDGRPVTTMSALVVGLRDHDPGDEVLLVYDREGRSRTVTVTVVEKPAGGG